MSNKGTVSCVVVWYNPELRDVINCVNSFVNQVDKIYIVDNSDEDRISSNAAAIKDFTKIEYIPLGTNKGIAKALNIGFQRAIAEDFSYVLTLDQDSSCSPRMIEKLLSHAKQLNKNHLEYGIITAQPDTPQRAKQTYVGTTIKETVIASGNLVSTDAYKSIGGFKDELFIDYVDCWFSLDIRRAGYKILQVNDAILKHNLGHIEEKKLFGIRMFPTNHSISRHYYIARNRLYTRQEFNENFPEFFKWERINNLKFMVKTFLFERDRIKKLRMILKGRKDFRNGVTGKY